LLEQFVAPFGRVITTPHVLTEVSNLLMKGHGLNSFAAGFKAHIMEAQEIYDQSDRIVEERCFPSFGLTDTAISKLGRKNFLVLTDDFRLYAMLLNRGVDAINFNHVRMNLS